MRSAFSDLHPWVSFLFFALTLVYSMIFMHPAYLAVTLVSAIVCHASLHGFGRTARFLLGLLPVFILLSVINPVFNRYGEIVLFTYCDRPYTLEALYYGMAIGAMFVSMLIWFSCYAAVMTCDRFIALFGGMIPSLSLLLVMVFRLVPSYQRKARQIMGARSGIGCGMTWKNRREGIAQGMTVLSALTGWALENAIFTADAMRSRGYGTTARTSFRIYRFTLRDGIIMAILALFAVAVTASALLGTAKAQYTPVVSIAPINVPGLVSYALLTLIPGMMNYTERIVWHILISKT